MTAELAIAGETAPQRSLRIRRMTSLSDAARTMAMLLIAPRGAGKSRFLGRMLVWQDVNRGVPTVLIDPTGGAISNFLDQVLRQPRERQIELGRRIRYVDLAGRSGRVLPMPMLVRYGTETLWDRSQRFSDIVLRMDANLAKAPMAGLNAVRTAASASGIALGALELQITEAFSLMTNPKAWLPVLDDARLATAETAPVAQYLRDFAGLGPRERMLRTEALQDKLRVINWDPVSRVLYGASKPAFSWQEVVDERLIVLVDLSTVKDVTRQQLGMLWMLRSFVEWLRERGAGHNHVPVSLIIDELTALLAAVGSYHELIADDFNELIARLARSHQLWLTVAFQELAQVPEAVQRVLLQSGTVMLGATSDPTTALRFAKRWVRYDPSWVKKEDPVYATSWGVTHTIDTRTIEYSIEEQQLINSWQFMDLERYEFLIGTVTSEGRLPSRLTKTSIAAFDAGRFPDERLVEQAQALLSQRDGVRVSDAVAQIDGRVTAVLGDAPKTALRSASTEVVAAQLPTIKRKKVSG